MLNTEWDDSSSVYVSKASLSATLGFIDNELCFLFSICIPGMQRVSCHKPKKKMYTTSLIWLCHVLLGFEKFSNDCHQ